MFDLSNLTATAIIKQENCAEQFPKGAWSFKFNCDVNCSLMPNARSQRSTFSCNCRAGYQWNTTWCIRNRTYTCLQVLNSNGTDNNVTGGCHCDENYSWIGGTCQYNCSLVANATTNYSSFTEQCVCLYNLSFNPFTKKCEKPC